MMSGMQREPQLIRSLLDDLDMLLLSTKHRDARLTNHQSMESQYVEEHPEQSGEVVAESEAPPQLPTFGDIPLRECAIGRSLLAAMDEADWFEAAEILDGLYGQFLDLDSHYTQLFPQAYPIFRSAQESLEFLLDVEYSALWSANDQNILPADLFQEVDIRICSPSDESGPE